jgi:hypothetical protein
VVISSYFFLDINTVGQTELIDAQGSGKIHLWMLSGLDMQRS